MNSVDKLRDRDYRPGYRGEPTLEILADEIEAEIATNYCELPKDADGVTLHIGDMVVEEGDRIPCKVMSLILYEDCWDVNSCGMNPNFLHHYHAPTIEDVLIEMMEQAVGFSDAHTTVALDAVSEYADKLREVMCDE